MSFSENLRNLRKNHNMSQEEFAEMVGVSRQAVSKWESDDGFPEVEKLLFISKKLNVSLDSLFDLDALEKGTSASCVTNLSYEEMDEIAQGIVKMSVNEWFFDNCMVAIRDNMEDEWYRKEQAQSKMRLALTEALIKAANLNVVIAKNTSAKIVSEIQEQILKKIESNLSN